MPSLHSDFDTFLTNSDPLAIDRANDQADKKRNGFEAIDMDDADQSLITILDTTNSAGEVDGGKIALRRFVFRLDDGTGPLTADRTLALPSSQQIYVFINNTTSTAGPWDIILNAGGTPQTLEPDQIIFCCVDSSNNVLLLTGELRVEKDGYTYCQRELQVVRERSSTANDVYLTPIDPALTPCDENGCLHTNSDGSIKLDIPIGAISSGESIIVTATLFDNVEFLPSGELPEGTWETYAFNLGGASEITFTIPVTVQLENEIGFTAGLTIPLGYWNQNTQQGEHAGIGTVDASGQWVETTVTHFSNYDINFPASLSDVDILDNDGADDEVDVQCGGAGRGGCFINFKSGTVHEWVDTPTVEVLGESIGQQLSYSTDRANPSEVIDLLVSIESSGSVQTFGYMRYEMYIEGEKTASHYFPVDFDIIGEVGRLRYLWDGRNAQGDLLPPGAYQYQVRLTLPYLAQYCRPRRGIFGNEPDCVFGGTGRFVRAEKILWKVGTVILHGDPESPYGTGWVIAGRQQLYENEAGDVLIADGGSHDEFYFPQ